MTAKQSSSAELLRAVAECETISDEEIVAQLLSTAKRAKRLLTTGAVLAALAVLLPFAVDLDLLVSGSRQWVLILGLFLMLVVFVAFSTSSMPNARTVWDNVQFWPPDLWHLTPQQEQELLRHAQQHEELQPYVARWMESGHPLRLAQSQCVKNWIAAVKKEAEAESTAQELRVLRQQVLEAAGRATSAT